MDVCSECSHEGGVQVEGPIGTPSHIQLPGSSGLHVMVGADDVVAVRTPPLDVPPLDAPMTAKPALNAASMCSLDDTAKTKSGCQTVTAGRTLQQATWP